MLEPRNEKSMSNVTRERILVVEDELDLQELIRFNLARDGYRVACASNGREAIQLIKSNRPQLIVLDLLLPEVDGLQICRYLKAEPETRDIPVIMVTAKGEEADIVAGLEVGADDYLPKPFSPRVLVARIRALLRRKAAQEVAGERPITIHALQIHPGRFELLAGGEPIDLSFTEFRILITLARQPGWVFSRYQIVNAVRGDDVIVTDRSVDVHIANLRRKLGEYGSYVQTVRGVGYRFKA
jgi:two-component system phosphate regulon response regulator PhoB